jgi:hypothetical protein
MNCEYEGIIFPLVWAVCQNEALWISIAQAVRPGFAHDFEPCSFDRWIWLVKGGGMPNIFRVLLCCQDM